MKCENCNKEHDGSYGSGRFCSSKCARGFSTKSKRGEINKKVSKSLSGRESWVPKEKRNGHIFTDEERLRGSKNSGKKIKNQAIKRWKETGKWTRTLRPMVLEEQNNKCAICGMEPIWLGKPLPFILDHIDGNSENNNRENLRMICSNCDSQLDTYKSKNTGSGRHYRRERYKEGKSY